MLDSGVEENDGETRRLVIELGRLESVGFWLTVTVTCGPDLTFGLTLGFPGCLFCLCCTKTQGARRLQLGCARKRKARESASLLAADYRENAASTAYNTSTKSESGKESDSDSLSQRPRPKKKRGDKADSHNDNPFEKEIESMTKEMSRMNEATLEAQAVQSQITNELLSREVAVAEQRVRLEAESQAAMLVHKQGELALQEKRLAHEILAIDESKVKYEQMEGRFSSIDSSLALLLRHVVRPDAS